MEYGEELHLFESSTGAEVRKRSLEYPSQNDVWRLFALPGAQVGVLLFSPNRLGRAHRVHWIDTANLEDIGEERLDERWECHAATNRLLACNPGAVLSGPVSLLDRGANQFRTLCPNCLATDEMFVDEGHLVINEVKKNIRRPGLAVYESEGERLWRREFGEDKRVYLISTAPSVGRLLLWVGSRWIEPHGKYELLVLDAFTGATIATAVFAPRWISEVGPQLTLSYQESSEAALSPDGSKVAVRIGNELTVYAIEEAAK